MSKLRVYEVAKQLNKNNQEVISALKQQGIEVSSHMSTIEDKDVAKVKSIFQAAQIAERMKAASARKAEEAKSKGLDPNKKNDRRDGQKNRGDRNNNRNGENRNNRGNRSGDGERRDFNRDNRNGEGRGERKDFRGDRNNNRNGENRGERRDFNRDNRNGEGRGNRNGDGERRDFNRDNRNGENRGERRDFNRGDNRGNRSGDGERRDFNRDNRNGENRGERKDFRGDRNNNRDFNKDRDNDRRDFSKDRGEGRRSSKSGGTLGGDLPLNTKESRNGKDNRHSINREHSRDNNNRNKDNDRNGRNARRNNNMNPQNYEENMRKGPKNKKQAKPAPVVAPKPEPKEETIRNITLPDTVSLKDLADACKIAPAVIIKKLFLEGQMVTMNTEFSFEDASEIALEYNCIAEQEVQVDVIEELLKEEEEDEAKLTSRPPVVCVMGHVDHGKTSLLDRIRSTNVTAGEAGGITQHIGAYVVKINDEKITFLDTPGHEAFTSMRLRGAQATDIAILVVAADDGVMPQTVEAINHAKAAGVEVIVAINKIDKEGANVDRVKQELTEYGLISADWGGSTEFVPVSAKTGEGIEDLLETITLTAEMLELKANANRLARGLVIEAKLDKGRGPVATILIQKGTLHVGDTINVGHAFGRVRAMLDDQGNRVKAAGPSVPVEILGLNDVPFSGEVLMAHGNEKDAHAVANAFIAYSREKLLEETKSKVSLEDLFDQIQAGQMKELNIIVKADVQGSVEAVKQSLVKLSNEEVAIKVIHGGVGAINESDVTLASASNAIIIGFNVRPDVMAKAAVEREKVDMRLYRVIYNAIEDIEAAMKGMLDPVFQEKVIGHCEVRQLYKASGVGTIAGCYVLDGTVTREAQVRLVRGGIVVYEGTLASLKRFKDDVKEVKTGFECGLVFERYNDIKEGDQVESFIMEEIPR